MSRFPPRNPPDNAFSWSCCNCVCNFNLSTLYQVAILWSCLFVCLSVCWQICFYLKLSICLLQLKALRSPPLSLALHLLTSQFQPEVKRVTKVIGSHTDTQTQTHRHPHTNTQTPSHKHTYTHTHRHTDTNTQTPSHTDILQTVCVGLKRLTCPGTLSSFSCSLGQRSENMNLKESDYKEILKVGVFLRVKKSSTRKRDKGRRIWLTAPFKKCNLVKLALETCWHFVNDFYANFHNLSNIDSTCTLFLIFLLIFFKLRSSALLRGSLAGTG